MNFLWSLLGALLPAAAGMLVLVIGAFCSLFSLDANSQMGPGIGLIFVAAAIVILGALIWLISFIVFLCAGFSWRVEWILTGIFSALCFLLWWVLHSL